MKKYKKIIGIIINPQKIFYHGLQFIGPYLSDRLFLRLKFKLLMGETLNLEQPSTFNEKLQWLKLYNRKPEYTEMVDKYSVKEYVSKKIGSQYIIPTIAVFETVEDIKFDELPEQFVLKTTHGGGGTGVIICKDKKLLDVSKVKRMLNHSMHSDIYMNFREWPYKNVHKRIIVEKYMTDDSRIELKDYKFFCFNGEVKVVKIDFDRFISHKANYFDIEGKLLHFGEQCCPPDYNRKFDKPENWSKMIEIAQKLSENIPFVRIDLYNANGKIYFGEITFFPAAGMGKFTDDAWDDLMGSWINLENISQ